MSAVLPIVGLRPTPELAAKIASVPYDVVNTEEARALATGNEHSFLRVARSEIELDESIDPYSDAVYRHAAENLGRFVKSGILIQDHEPALYLYRLRMGDHVQTGVMGGVSVAEYRSGIIKTHEKTRVDKENDRIRHIISTRAHAEPVLLAYRAADSIDSLVTSESKQPPLYQFVSEDGIEHTIWRVSESDRLSALFGKVPYLYIADGHHRAASAARVSEELGEPNNRDAQLFPAVAFPDTQLQILPYNRVVKGVDLSASEILKKLSSTLTPVREIAPAPRSSGFCSMYLDGSWHTFQFKISEADHVDPIRSLDVTLLQEQVFTPLFGIQDPRTDKRLDFVGGIHGTKKLEELVNSGKAVCAFSLFPVSIAQLFAIADNDLLMPPKSTWFEPKLRSGLLVHPF